MRPGRSMILLTGASGYVGSRLLRELEAAGRTMRCLAGARARGGQPNHDRSRKGRRSRRIVAGRGDGGCGPGVLSRALHGERCAVRGARSRVGGQLRACRPSGRRTPHHLSRRPHRRCKFAVHAPEEPTRNGRDADQRSFTPTHPRRPPFVPKTTRLR